MKRIENVTIKILGNINQMHVVEQEKRSCQWTGASFTEGVKNFNMFPALQIALK
jgi:hypothetical protein